MYLITKKEIFKFFNENIYTDIFWVLYWRAWLWVRWKIPKETAWI